MEGTALNVRLFGGNLQHRKENDHFDKWQTTTSESCELLFPLKKKSKQFEPKFFVKVFVLKTRHSSFQRIIVFLYQDLQISEYKLVYEFIFIF